MPGSEYQKQWLSKGDNRKKGIAATRRWQKKNWHRFRLKSLMLGRAKVAFVQGLKKKGRCLKCGFSDFRALEWAHKKPKEYKPVWQWLSWEGIKAELRKCILLCANCHRIRDYAWRQRLDALKRRSKYDGHEAAH